MQNPAVVTPGSIAFDLDAVKVHLRVVGASEDAALTLIALAATDALQDYLGCAFTTTTYLWTRDAFAPGRSPTDDFWYEDRPSGPRAPVYLKLPFGPVQSVTHIKYLDDAGVLQTWSPSNYQLDTFYGRVAPVPGAVWPTPARDRFSAVQIQFVAGFGATFTSIPARVTLGLYMLIGHWFENREELQTFTLQHVPLGLFNLIDEFKR